MSEKKYLVTIKGIGQLGGPVNINKTLELDFQMQSKLKGPHREEVIEGIIQTHYPGVKFNPRQIGITIEEVKENLKKNKKENSNSNGGCFSSIIFLPFKIVWRLFNWLTS